MSGIGPITSGSAPNVNNLLSTANAAAIAAGHNALLVALRTGGLLAPNPTYDQMVLAASGLQGYYILGEPSGTACVDALAGLNGTYGGGPTFGVTGPLPDDPHTAVTFVSGSGNYAHFLHPMGGSDFAVMLFIKRTVIDARQQIIDGIATGTFSVDLGAYADNKPLYTWTGHSSPIAGPALTDMTSWHHLIFTKTGTTCKYIIDGAATSADSGADTFIASSDWNLGIHNSGLFLLDASLSRLATFNRGLTDGESAAFYARSLVP